MKKTSDLDTSLIRHDYQCAVYRAMLSELPPGEIIDCPAIRIQKTGRGRFSLRVTGGLQYREKAPIGEIAEAAD